MCYKCNKTGHYANKFGEETTVKPSNVPGKKGWNVLLMKEGMLDSSLDDVEDYKESTIPNMTIEEAEQENSDDDTKEASSDDEGTDTDDDYDRIAFVKEDVLCSMQDKPAIPKSWILLDTQSRVDVFSNPKLLDNICDAKRVLTLNCNPGKL